MLPPRNLQAPSQPVKQQRQPVAVPKPQVKSEPVPVRGFASGVKEALSILASEVGSPESDLTDDVAFADYGVDSLLSLTVTGRYREELNLDLDSSVFADCPTVGAFKEHLARMNTSGSSSASTDESASSLSLNTSSSVSSMSSAPDQLDKPTQSKANGTLLGIHRIIAEEIGMEVGAIPETQNLGDLGVDSLLALTALGRMREELELDLSDQFFMEHQTLQDISAALSLDPNPASESPSSAGASSPSSQEESQPSTVPKHPAATSILLQGSPSSAKKNLFLFPDGSGSATSYASLPGLSPDTCVYGLNCPYMKQPENLKCSLDELSGPYINEIRRRQPRGPYNLGGWSAGGICAFDAARRLIVEEGEAVSRLILIDSPFPIGLEKLPHRLYDFFNTIGLFGEGKAPPPRWLLPHFLAFIDSLDAYRAVSLPYDDAEWAHRMPKTYLIWAKDGVCGKPGDPRPAPAADGQRDPREMAWLLNDRTDFGPNKWDTLVGPDNVSGIGVIEGANHFTMTKGAKSRELSDFLAGALEG